eukprot:CAMPEP_0175739754 /NCGR_PEP_ID=MMETSP0097-20121207/55160_1 /TAXON_ID=311494 /ORGANISM="Alexandrium monilatum, Strain CCMP3105" /LENGTH=53 /DNA_ID=CAMNT_0017048013 /DNA_START=24 /DNA_END=182 /DNA_ORIENTATION=-
MRRTPLFHKTTGTSKTVHTAGMTTEMLHLCRGGATSSCGKPGIRAPRDWVSCL